MFIVISNHSYVDQEAEIINKLFTFGMPLFHLRKPTATDIEVRDLLLQIDSEFHPRIALHNFHELADEFNITRLHFSELKREIVSDEALINYKKKDITLSSSIHDLEDLEDISESFDYVFCSPVFDSISKENYRGKVFDKNLLKLRPSIKKIALGGIDLNTVTLAHDYGFDGVAVLGAMWTTKNPIAIFKLINNKWKIYVQ